MQNRNGVVGLLRIEFKRKGEFEMYEDDNWDESPEQLNDDKINSVKRYEEMQRKKESWFFDADVLNNVVDFYIEQDDLPKSLETIRYALKLHPTAYWFLLREANILSRQDNHVLALEKLKLFELSHPLEVDFYIIKAHVLGNMEQFNESLICFRKALELTDERDTIYHDMAYLYSDMADFGNSILYMQKYIRAGNEDMVCCDQLIQWLILTNRLKEGIDFFNQRIDTNPYSAISWLCLATVNKELRQYEDALHALDYCLVIEPNEVHALIEQGDVFFLTVQYNEALTSYKKAAEIWPTHALTFYNIGECYERLNNLELAREYYHIAIKLQPELAAAWYSIGMVLSFKEKWYDAIHYFKKSLELEPKNSEFWFALGDSESNLNHLKEAKECYENVIELDPTNEDIWVEYSMLLFENNFFTEAVYVIQEGIKMHPDNPDYYYYLTCFLYAKGDLKQSYLELETALDKNFDNYQMLFDINHDLIHDKTISKIIALRKK